MSETDDSTDAETHVESDDPGQRGTGPRSAFLIAGAMALVLVAVAIAIVMRILGGGGQQAAEVMPDDTIAYLAIDLDPPAEQKIAAYRFLRAFPDVRDEVSAESDIRSELISEIVDSLECEGLDPMSVESWIGSRIAVAARRDGDTVSPSMVVQVEDAEAARSDLALIGPCLERAGAADADPGAYGVTISGDYAVLAPSQAESDAAVAAAQDGSLADDGDFQQWMGRAGDDGIVEGYLSADAGAALGDLLRGELGGFGEFGEGFTAEVPPESSAEIAEAFDGLGAASMSLRFDDKTLELSTAVQTEEAPGREGTLIGTLPETTEVAVAGNLPAGWAQGALDRIETQVGDLIDVRTLLRQFARETGLEAPGDIETLLGERTALAVSGGVVAAVNAADASGGEQVDIPLGVLAEGDPDAIGDVVDKLAELSEQAGVPVVQSMQDRRVAFGFSQAWTDELARADGRLAEDDGFGQVIPDGGDAGVAIFVDLDGEIARSLRGEIPEGDRQDYDDVVGPLSALGVSGVYDDGALVYRIRLGVD